MLRILNVGAVPTFSFFLDNNVYSENPVDNLIFFQKMWKESLALQKNLIWIKISRDSHFALKCFMGWLVSPWEETWYFWTNLSPIHVLHGTQLINNKCKNTWTFICWDGFDFGFFCILCTYIKNSLYYLGWNNKWSFIKSKKI